MGLYRCRLVRACDAQILGPQARQIIQR